MKRTLFFVGPWDLNRELPCVPREANEGRVLLVESEAKGSALPYHRQKLVLVLSAMHHFAKELRADGYTARVTRAESYVAALRAEIEITKAERVVALRPREWGLERALEAARDSLGAPLELFDDGGEGSHFLLSREEFRAWADGKRQLRMHDFYVWMRKRTGYLMDGNQPIGGQWSFDAKNRQHARGTQPPRVPRHTPDPLTQQIMKRVARWPNHWGSVEGFGWPVTRAAAIEELDHFFQFRAESFGRYQDAMLQGEAFLWHSLISPSINLSLLSPREVCERIQLEFTRGSLPIESAEGLLRQVLGWREFIRGIYWRRMPELRTANLLGATRPLPDFFWEPEKTDLECLRQSVGHVRDHGYAHHIQRLMVQGNFALLAGVDPLQISHWFWAAFVDAYEWVELPNVVGMAVYADDTFTTKPYAASGNYIAKMSDYCKSCPYDVKQRSGPEACPYNSLFWSFMQRHRARLTQNPRLAVLYKSWDKLPQ
ncbi:MAG: cryptochrome/photolyase family protein, partial [Myxococcales bacterium]|nr:cryptochrome/photolyase family protein [Myxococcales bacterium]